MSQPFRVGSFALGVVFCSACGSDRENPSTIRDTSRRDVLVDV